MRTAIDAVIIQNKRLLIVRKKETWILPGGKPERDEDDEHCLRREIREELMGTEIKNIRFYDKFIGRTPHQGDILECRAYFADIDGVVHGVSKNDSIISYAWMGREERSIFPLSQITGSVVDSLIKVGYL